MRNYGLSEYRIREIIMHFIQKNPDIYYFIDNQYVEQIVNSLVDGVAEVIVENNRKLIESISRDLR